MTQTISPIQGPAWVFAEANINTDLIMPTAAFNLPVDERPKLAFSANRPGWSDRVQSGDVLVGGKNFGTGSSRPGAEMLRALGIGALVAESINDLFYRNCINFALPAIECPGAIAHVTEGDLLRVDLGEGLVTNLRTGASLRGSRMPAMLWEIIQAGGIYERLRRDGYV